MPTIAKIEVTDTFCGEANYSWVWHHEFDCTGMSNRAVTIKVKELINWKGIRCDRENYGDCWIFRPRGLLQVCFVDFKND